MVENPMDKSLDEVSREMELTPIMPAAGLEHGQMMRQTQNGVITAQRVDVPRDLAKVTQTLAVLATSMSTEYIYSIPFKDKRKGTTTYVEGLTVKGAQDLARVYGNCQVDVTAEDFPEHWVYNARFVDLETGFSLSRPYIQHKDRKTSTNMEAGRQQENMFLIGASKATRNVIVNALQSFASKMEKEAKNGVIKTITARPDACRAWILSQGEEHGIPADVMARAIEEPKTPGKWSIKGMASLYKMLGTINDGIAPKEEVFELAAPTTRKRAAAPKPRKTNLVNDEPSVDASVEPEEGQDGPASQAQKEEEDGDVSDTHQPDDDAGDVPNIF